MSINQYGKYQFDQTGGQRGLKRKRSTSMKAESGTKRLKTLNGLGSAISKVSGDDNPIKEIVGAYSVRKMIRLK